MKRVACERERQADRLRVAIARARALFALHGESLSDDPGIGRLLAAYREAIARTGELMRESGVCAACARCAGFGHGSCCFQGIENEYDSILLLVNLLLGCSLPDEPAVPESCFFLGEEGCRLPARYYFCVNYLCPDLQESLDPEVVRRLLHAVGRELSAGWEVEHALRRSPDIGEREGG